MPSESSTVVRLRSVHHALSRTGARTLRHQGEHHKQFSGHQHSSGNQSTTMVLGALTGECVGTLCNHRDDACAHRMDRLRTTNIGTTLGQEYRAL